MDAKRIHEILGELTGKSAIEVDEKLLSFSGEEKGKFFDILFQANTIGYKDLEELELEAKLMPAWDETKKLAKLFRELHTIFLLAPAPANESQEVSSIEKKSGGTSENAAGKTDDAEAEPLPDGVTLASVDGGFEVKTPYNPAFVGELKSRFASGERKWDPSRKFWVVKTDDKALLILLVEKFFGDGDVELPDIEKPEPKRPTLWTATDDTGEFKSFWLESEYEDRHIPQAAGFVWNKIKKDVWATMDTATASKLIEYADDETRERLEGIAKKREASKEASRAGDADIEIPAPQGLEYLPFQKAGIKYAAGRKSTLVGDEMGLGKTIQSLGVINADESIKSALIVCPASLKLNWKAESEKWLVREFSIGIAKGKDVPETEIVIINWDILNRNKEAILSRKWDLLIADEAHYAKNEKAARTKALQAVAGKSAKRLLLTGTPIVNRPIELFSLLKVLGHPLSGNFWQYAKRYCAAHNNGWGWDFSGSANLDELQEELRSTVMVRRLKKDVLPELPAKRRQIVALDTNGMVAAIRKEAKALASKERAEKKLLASRNKSEKGSDAYKTAVEKLRDLRQVWFEEMSQLRHETALRKVPKVVDFCKEALESEDKIIVFAHHKDVVAALLEGLAEFNPVHVVGDDSQEARQAAVEAFQKDAETRVFVGSIQAAGTGLTLTAASTVVFAELDWVPGNMSQAEDRAHRIGQANMVNIFHVVIDESLDARLAKTLIEKQSVLDAALDDESEQTVIEKAVEKSEAEKEHKLRSEKAKVVEFETREQRLATELKNMNGEKIAAVHNACKVLAGVCDGAQSWDGEGFNKFDAPFGHALANAESLTRRQAAAAKKMLKKYHHQLPYEILGVLWPGEFDDDDTPGGGNSPKPVEVVEMPVRAEVGDKSSIMKRAWQIRRLAAERWGCKVMEIHWGECLRLAWSEAKGLHKNAVKAA